MNSVLLRTIVCAALLWATATGAGAEPGFLLLASTIAPIDAGIVPALEDAFEAESGIRVRHVGAGTGEALKIAEKGAIDLVLVHARSLEEKFVAAGFGTERVPFMYNDYVIVGPAADPAGIKGLTGAAAALKRIAASGSPFITRGDKSGTHVAELELWASADIKPQGGWYRVFDRGSEGNVPTLKYTDQQQAYTVIDRATYLTLKKSVTLSLLVEGDEALLNRMSLIAVNPKKIATANYRDAGKFISWLTAPDKGQRIIAQFGIDTYGSPLFFPDSAAWRSQQQK